MLADAIKSLGAKAFTVTCSTGGMSYDAQGRAMNSTPVAPRSVVALIQPVNGRDIQLLPEGVYQKESRVLFTMDALNVAGEGTDGDLVVIGVELWSVAFVFDWTDAASFNKYLITKEDP